MKLSENWLKEWVNTKLEAKEIAELLTMAGLEVDAVSPVAGQFKGVIVASVLSTTLHPQADKLTICQIDTGHNQPISVVCGAANVRPGLKVALATIGAELPNNLVIKETKLRGELSQGMLCSASELGLSDSSEGILELEEDAPLGQDLRSYLNLEDNIFDIDLTPNRADCLSARGIARELAALTQQQLNSIEIPAVSPKTDEQKNVYLEAERACPHYCGRIISNINAQAMTPLWMRERLRRSGIRSIHPVVDVTNYVMLELGQPMHAFDAEQLEGNIHVRYAHADEALLLLDERDIELSNNLLIIADEKKPLALAGVMGGAASAVNEDTRTIFLESAYFTPHLIAGVARKFGLHTDSSLRYERGVDAAMQLQAIERATKLLLEIVGGTAGPITEVVHQEYLPKIDMISFDPKKVKNLTGMTISFDRMMDILQSLGMKVESNQEKWLVTPPSYRFDISLDVDLIEEIIRIQGYDSIPTEKMSTVLKPGQINAHERLAQEASLFFLARGYHEAISYSFVDPDFQRLLFPEQEGLDLVNPLSSELSQMRMGMWPGLLAAMIHNAHRQQSSIKLFETGVIFTQNEHGLKETPCLGGLLTGSAGQLNWNEPNRSFDFYDAKGDLQALFSLLNLKNVSFHERTHSALHPGKSAEIIYADKSIGWCGCLHPKIADDLDIEEEVVLFEIKIPHLLSAQTVRYQPISKYPQIRRDLALIVAENQSVTAIEHKIKEIVPKAWLKALYVFDVYRGASIPEGKKSLAFALILQDDTKTLIDNEINEVINAILKTLEADFSITLRD